MTASASRLVAGTARREQMLMLALSAAHATVLLTAPVAPVIALGLWWNANTIAHNFIHRPFFQHRAANWLFAGYLSVLLGFPQSLWRDRHLAHHGLHQRCRRRSRLSGELVVQAGLVLIFWTTIVFHAPRSFLFAYLPGYIGGLVLCALHGYYEHARGTTSHYGALYNLLFLNDGYHAEHHAHPGMDWTRLPEHREPGVRVSAWPAPFRWIEAFTLEGLERVVLRSGILKRFVLRTHARALGRLIGTLPPVDRIAIVGGGLFPRTAIILQRLLPVARITIIDANSKNLDRARALLGVSAVMFVHACYPQVDMGTYDLIVFPLSFAGNRGAIYADPPAGAVIVHDWIWRRRGVNEVVSIALLKRVNLVRR